MTNTTTYALVGLGGLAVVLTAAALIKKKPALAGSITSPRALPAPRFYFPAQGDNAFAVAARLGTTVQKLGTRNVSAPVRLPAGLADLGPRAGAQGKIK